MLFCHKKVVQLHRLIHIPYVLSFQNQPVFPREVVSQCQGVRMDPKFCPFNSSLVSFINNNDLWVTNTDTGEEKPLTFAHKGMCISRGTCR